MSSLEDPYAFCIKEERIGPTTPASMESALENLYAFTKKYPGGPRLTGLRLERDLSIEYDAGEVEGRFVQGPHPVLVLIFEDGDEVAIPVYKPVNDDSNVIASLI